MHSRSREGATRAGVVVTVAVALATLAACASGPSPAPVSTAAPTQAGEAFPSAGSVASAPPSAFPSGDPGVSPSPTLVDAGSAIRPGAVDRTSLDLTATYNVDATITVRTGLLDATTEIVVLNGSGAGIDRVELNTIAARLGGLRLTTATVDGELVDATVADQTIEVPLGGVLPDGATATIRIGYRATLTPDLSGSDWMFSRAGGTLALYRWIPWISRAVPFSRPNHGDPFVTVSSPKVDVELLADEPLVLAAPAASVSDAPAGPGQAWSFSVSDVRDVSVVLAPDFRRTDGAVNGLPIRVYTRPGGLAPDRLMKQAVHAVTSEAAQLGVVYPAEVLTVVQTQGGFGLESPGLIWIPGDVDTTNLAYLVHHETAHQWFYGMVGNDQQADPFADEAAADLLARTVLGTLRASRCPTDVLDEAITAYTERCYYEVVYVQGGQLLDEIRRAMGSKRFWGTLAAYLDAHRDGISGTKALLDALRGASSVDLVPILRPRFPSLYP